MTMSLLILRDLIILRISSLVKLVTDKLDIKLRFNKLGHELSFVIGVYFEAKHSLKSLALSLK